MCMLICIKSLDLYLVLLCHMYMCGVGCLNPSIWCSVLSHMVEYRRSIVCSSEQLCYSIKRCSLLRYVRNVSSCVVKRHAYTNPCSYVLDVYLCDLCFECADAHCAMFRCRYYTKSMMRYKLSRSFVYSVAFGHRVRVY